MKMGGLVTACAAVIFLTIGSGTIAAQDQGRSEHERNGHTKFDDHDRQVSGARSPLRGYRRTRGCDRQ
jgi:hypothetical protein